jgi:hypothetical protein
MRHRPSQKTRAVFTLVDEVVAAVGTLMRISSRNEGEFGNLDGR